MNVLYGKANPCGKLAETFPVKLEDNPSFLNFPVSRHKVNYVEGVFVGYRYYDTKKMEVLFPFGFGLSYTEFEYSNLRVTPYEGVEYSDWDIIGINSGAKVLVDVTNVGNRKGKEVVQLYVADKTGVINRPSHELKGFEKVELEPGETKTVTFELDKRSFAWFSTELNDWYAADGKYDIEIGKSSRDIVLSEEIELTGSFQIPPIIDKDVQLGELLSNKKTRIFTMGIFSDAVTQFSGEESSDGIDEMNKAMLEYMPIRTLRSFGELDNETIEKIIAELKKLM